MTGVQLTRYDGPKDVVSLRQYAHLLAGGDNPKGLANSALPPAFRGNPAALAFAVEYAKALDVAPVTAITGMHVIDGKPSASAGLISALIRRAGHKFRVWTEGNLDDLTIKAVATLIRVDDPDYTYRADWTLQDAERAELLTFVDGRIHSRTERGKRTQWEKYPAAMLKARVITEIGREAAEDALMGVHYTPEELGAEVNDAGEPVTPDDLPTPPPPAAQPSQAEAAKADDIHDAVVVETSPAPNEPPPPPPGPLTAEQSPGDPIPPPTQDNPSDRPTESPEGVTAEDYAVAALESDDVEEIRDLYRKAGDTGRRTLVTDALTDQDRALLEAPGVVELGSLLMAAGRYVEAHAVAVRDPRGAPSPLA